MKSKLIVKNFGPIESATLNLNNVNVLIGPQASGKSTLAKLYTICKSPVMCHQLDGGKFSSIFYRLKEIKKENNAISELAIDKFKKSLEHFSIGGFLLKNTFIEFDCPTHKMVIENNKIFFTDKINLDKLLLSYEDKDIHMLKSEFDKFRKISDRFNFKFIFGLFWEREYKTKKINDENFIQKFQEFNRDFDKSYQLNLEEARILINTFRDLKTEIFNNNAIYIPAERTIVNLIKQASFAFQKGKVPLPDHLLDYALVYQNSTEKVREFDLGFLKEGALYKNVNGIDKIYFSSRKSIKLTESASGFQSVIPMLLPILNERNNNSSKEHYSFVIEEPETNLFPKAQYELLKFLEKDRDDDFDKIDKGIIHTYTTHSPFILSSLNNMLYAFKKGNLANNEVKEKINKILSEKNWIDPKYFSAYQIIDGKAKSIMDRKTGLIKDNVIDYVSEDIIDDFRKIAIASI